MTILWQHQRPSVLTPTSTMPWNRIYYPTESLFQEARVAIPKEIKLIYARSRREHRRASTHSRLISLFSTSLLDWKGSGGRFIRVSPGCFWRDGEPASLIHIMLQNMMGISNSVKKDHDLSSAVTTFGKTRLPFDTYCPN